MSETASPKKRVVKDSQIEGGEESAVRSRKKKEKKERKEAESEDVDNVDEEMETSSKAKGYNWSAITLMLMFILPALLGGWIMVCSTICHSIVLMRVFVTMRIDILALLCCTEPL